MNLLDQFPLEWDLGPAQPEFRRGQIAQWVFERKADSFAAMSNLPEALRAHLAATYTLRPLEIARAQGSRDTTRKFLWKLAEGDFIESVLIPANVDLFGERASRQTLCLSSQVGCAYGCKFCASGLEGWKRNLSPAEIAGQVLEAERIAGSRIQNLVFMGMGEPLANYENLMKAIETINSPWGLNIGARHITLSTSGLVPQIELLANQPRQLRLAISLHGASDEVRSRIMPVNRKYPLAALLDACARYQEKKGQMITFEYILIEGVNDAPEEAKLLARHARRVKAKVNLIPYNTVEGLPWKRPADAVIDAFAVLLKNGGCTATVRHEKGHDIDAACGQLRLRELRGDAAN